MRAALTDGNPVPPQTTVFDHGDKQWFQHPGSRPVDAQPDSAADAKPLKVVLAPDTYPRRRGLKRVTPSGLEGGSTVKLAHVFSGGNAAALQRGSLMHAWFERIEWLDDGRPDENTLRSVAAANGVVSLQIDPLMAQFYEFLDRPQIFRVLSRASYQPPRELKLPAEALDQLAAGPVRVEAHNERRFAIRQDDALLSGSIDRLVLMYQSQKLVAADIIDFKTDDVSADDADTLAARVEYYRDQLEAYRPAVSKLYHIPPDRISARLVFVSPGVVRNI